MEEIRISCLYPFCQTLHFSPSKSRYLHHICSLQQFSCFTKSHSLIASLPVLFSYRFSQISQSPPLPLSQMSRTPHASPWPRSIGSTRRQSPSGMTFSKVASQETTQTSTQRSWNSNLSLSLHFTLLKPLSSSPLVASEYSSPNHFSSSSSSSSLISQPFPGMMSL